MPGLMEILSYAGNAIDLPASSLRDLVTGSNPFDQWATPFSSENRTSGRDMLNPIFGKNKETGMAGWLDDPMEGVADVLGFGAEMVLDPLNFVSGAGVVRALKGSKAAKSANKVIAAENASNAGKYGYVNAKLAGQADELVNPITQQAPQKLLGYTPERPTVYHGGHDWSASATPENPYGMFDVGRLKTGEGANAYGPGAYFAEAESTSRSYRDIVRESAKDSMPLRQLLNTYWDAGEMVSDPGEIASFVNKNIPEGPHQQDLLTFNKWLQENDWLGYDVADPKEARHLVEDVLEDSREWDFFEGMTPEVQSMLQRLNSVPKPKARLYQLDMPAEVTDRFVAWDNPMREQPAGVAPLVDKFNSVVSEDSLAKISKLHQVRSEQISLLSDLKSINHKRLISDGDRAKAASLEAQVSSLREQAASLRDDILGAGVPRDVLKSGMRDLDSGSGLLDFFMKKNPGEASLADTQVLKEAGVPGVKNLAGSTGRNTYNYAIWDQHLLNQLPIRAIDGQRVPINPTTLVQQVAQPLPQVADPMLMRSMNPMRPLQQLPGIAAPAATTAVYNVLARQNNYGGVM